MKMKREDLEIQISDQKAHRASQKPVKRNWFYTRPCMGFVQVKEHKKQPI